MKHPFSLLAPEYDALLRSVKITRTDVVPIARRLLSYKARYLCVSQTIGVPIAVLAALHERESTANFRTYLGNGETLNRVTRLVPKGRGPFESWEAGADDALRLEHFDTVKNEPGGWSWAKALYECEMWNGFGPRAHGRHTGYLWSGTSQYDGGKYVADGVWSPTTKDQQLGVVPIMLTMIALDATLAFAPVVIVDDEHPLAPVAPPIGLGGSSPDDVRRLQNWLNKIHVTDIPLALDGSYGRRTRTAVMAFQSAHGLVVDGLAGPITLAALVAAAA